MSIVLFALIGAYMKAGVAYWICFSIHCLIRVILIIAELAEKLDQ